MARVTSEQNSHNIHADNPHTANALSGGKDTVGPDPARIPSTDPALIPSAVPARIQSPDPSRIQSPVPARIQSADLTRIQSADPALIPSAVPARISHQNKPVRVDMSPNAFNWFIVRFDKPHQELKFQKFVYDNRDISKNIIEVYCPTHTVVKEYYSKSPASRPASQPASQASPSQPRPQPRPHLRPLFAGADFVYATFFALSDFLRKYCPGASIQYKKRLRPNQPSGPLIVPEKEMTDFRNFNENFADKVVLLPKSIKEYAFNNKGDMPNETLRIVDGPMAGLTGYLIKLDGNKGLAFQINNPYGGQPFTFGILNIWDFHVVRVHNVSEDRQSLSTMKARAVDLLIGLLQKDGCEDKVLMDRLYSIMEQLRQGRSLVQAYPAMNGLSLSDKELILNLIRYEKDEPGFVRKNWPRLTIRPFLTPTSGIHIPEGKDYALLPHSGFMEIVKRTRVEEEAFDPSHTSAMNMETCYYAHVGMIRNHGGVCTFFSDWNKFLGEYFATEGEGRKRLNVSFANHAPTLLKVLRGEEASMQAVPSMHMGRGPCLNVMALSIPYSGPFEEDDLLADEAMEQALSAFIATGLAICREISSSSHLALWRGLISDIWLHI